MLPTASRNRHVPRSRLRNAASREGPGRTSLPHRQDLRKQQQDDGVHEQELTEGLQHRFHPQARSPQYTAAVNDPGGDHLVDPATVEIDDLEPPTQCFD